MKQFSMYLVGTVAVVCIFIFLGLPMFFVTSQTTTAVNWWELGRSDNVNWDVACKQWPHTEIPSDFPVDMGYDYAGPSLTGTVEVSPESEMLDIYLPRSLTSPSVAMPVEAFPDTHFQLVKQFFVETYPQINLVSGKIKVWLAVSIDKGAALVMQMPTGEYIEAFLSPPVFAAPCA